ncbi:hypothetical protein T8S45_05590 [Blastomonas marina]|uniref:hypothetical protein n=1 Tax=Blastomonas marina TaxID=1867408 RepID=UPI0026BA339A|nr:hypothetical protein [Blastomonas marina]WPZ05011.1 hypothetical protein T8S45_05590 [Blastomonas marina]
MRKLVSIAASVALAGSASIVAVPTAVSAQGASTLVDACKQFYDIAGYESIGDCVGSIRSQAPRTCRALEGTPIYTILGFRNRGDCVAYIRNLQNG